jgi:hypothetical protein
MDIFLLVVSHFAVGAVAYLIGETQMKKKIERELMQVLNEFANKKEEE